MADTAVVNTSPLICLCRDALSDLLRRSAETVVVPASALGEGKGEEDITLTPDPLTL